MNGETNGEFAGPPGAIESPKNIHSWEPGEA